MAKEEKKRRKAEIRTKHHQEGASTLAAPISPTHTEQTLEQTAPVMEQETPKTPIPMAAQEPTTKDKVDEEA